MVAAPTLPDGRSTAAAAWMELAGAPLPSRRQEDWRFTDLAALTALNPKPMGGFDPWGDLVLPEGVSRLTEAELATHLGSVLGATGCAQHWPVRLNRGATPALLALRVRGEAGPLTLEAAAGDGAGLLALRVLLLLEDQSSLELLQLQHASAANATSLVVEAALGRGSRLKLGLLAEGHQQACLLAHLAVQQAQDSSLELTTVTSGWALSRLEPRVVQPTGAARTQLRGLQWVSGQQLADTHSLVRFDGPDGSLDQLHKVVAGDAGRSVFNGAVEVPRLAQRTQAAQLSRSLLLSDRARIDTKPELEIVADDVRCAHGATVSQLQCEELFYLQSRGIARDQAARLLLQGYCQEVLNALPAAAASRAPLARPFAEV
jgi:Fe-S cluster assembly protein SufD